MKGVDERYARDAETDGSYMLSKNITYNERKEFFVDKVYEPSIIKSLDIDNYQGLAEGKGVDDEGAKQFFEKYMGRKYE